MRQSALVVGMGSIGRRHARLLGELGFDVSVVSAQPGPANRYSSIPAALKDNNAPRYVVIANPTAKHHHALSQLAAADFSGVVLVEKPLFDQPLPLPANRFNGLYVGYNLRFHPLIRELGQLLAADPAVSAQVYAGQYLPEWRPERDYRATSSATRASGGGVLRDLSHELDYLTWLFGRCQRVAALGGRFSALEIDCDDTQALLLSFERCPVATVQLNYLDRDGARELVINTATRTIRADLRRGRLRIGDAERLFATERDATYLAQHRCVLGNNRDLLCSAAEGAAITSLIAAIEHAEASANWVML